MEMVLIWLPVKSVDSPLQCVDEVGNLILVHDRILRWLAVVTMVLNEDNLVAPFVLNELQSFRLRVRSDLTDDLCISTHTAA